ncbi:MAG: T9SS type A sorting domain-containing protein [Bacteroidales bacterium]|jgi:hypothetical protein|nr:T9SS type A sorting domain-containing protein [Bacteroidales bacterium]
MKRSIKYFIILLVSSILSFASYAQEPIVDTYQAYNITSNSATLRAKVKRGEGGDLLIARGFALKQALTETYSYYMVSSTDSIIEFEATDLLMNTRYHVAAVAVTMDGLFLGDTLSFTTLNPIIDPQIITTDIASLSQNSALLSGNLINIGNPPTYEKGFIFSSSPSLTFQNAEDTLVFSDALQGGYQILKEGLVENTTYYYCAYAKNENITMLGQIESFTTLEQNIVLPTILTLDAEQITDSSVYLQGEVTSLGNQQILGVGFDIREFSNPTFTTTSIMTYTDNFSITIDTLQHQTTYIYRAYAMIEGNVKVFGETKFFTSLEEPAVFQTNSPENISSNSAIMNGYIFNSDITLQTFGFALREGDNDYSFYDVSQNFTLPASIYYSLTGLNPYTQYTYKVFGIGFNDVYYGDEVTFYTNSVPSSVQTYNATNLSYNSAQLNGRLVENGTPQIIEKGFLYSTYSNPTFSNSTKVIVDGFEEGAYSNYLYSLNQSTQYYYKSFAISPIDTSYGETISFTTLEQGIISPTLTTLQAEEILYNSAKLSGVILQGNQPIVQKGFQYKEEGEENYTNVLIYDNNIEATITNLQPNTTYLYRVFCQTSTNTFYGEELFFSTPPIPMIVTTLNATNITLYSSQINGNIYDGTEVVMFKGFEWKLSSDTIFNRVFLLNVESEDINYELTDLNPNTEYVFKAFAKTDSGFFYGNEVSFTTLPIIDPIFSAITITDIDTLSATFNANVQEGTFPIIVSVFSIRKFGEEIYSNFRMENNEITLQIDTLLEGTTYYLRLFAMTEEGIYSSEEISFTTLGTPNIGLSDIVIDETNIKMYPLPARDKVEISFNGISKRGVKCIIRDALSKDVLTKMLYNDKTTLDIHSLQSGIYTLTFYFEDKVVTKKLIINK